MALTLSESQETGLNISLPVQRQKGASFVPRNYYKSRPSQLQIPQGPNPTSYPTPLAILPSQASHSPHHSRHSSESPSVNEASNMVWEQAHLSSSTTSESLYLSQMSNPGKNISGQMYSIMAGVSPSVTSGTLGSPPFFPNTVEDINFTQVPYGRSNSMPLFSVPCHVPAAPGYSPAELEFDTPMYHPHMESSASPDGYYIPHTGQWTPPPQGLGDEMYGPSMMDANMGPGSPHGSAIYGTEPREISLINQPYHPDQNSAEEDIPPYAELIYMALMSAPGHQMHLQDIYQWFKDNYAKFRLDTGKGWMNSIRHNLSMNGAFVKVERPSGEPGKGYMWLLAPAAVEGGIKSTTRYRKKGRAVDRVSMTPDASYGCYVTPKRNRCKRLQTKARRTRKDDLQHRQQVNQQQQQQPEPSSFPEFDTAAVVHTPGSIDMPPMTPDFSSYHSEGFSETLSVGSRHATPALRGNEWHSSASAHGHGSPFYPPSDDGFSSSFDTPLGNYPMYGPYDGEYDDRHE